MTLSSCQLRVHWSKFVKFIGSYSIPYTTDGYGIQTTAAWPNYCKAMPHWNIQLYNILHQYTIKITQNTTTKTLKIWRFVQLYYRNMALNLKWSWWWWGGWEGQWWQTQQMVDNKNNCLSSDDMTRYQWYMYNLCKRISILFQLPYSI